MSATVVIGAAPSDRVAWEHLRTLAAIEARGYAKRASIWVGWAATVLSASQQRGDWSGGSYEWVIPLSFAFMILGVFVAGVRTGTRDTDRDLPPLAEEAPLDGDDRLAARLLGLAMPVGLALATTVAMAIVSRVEGGFWMGLGDRRTDSAVHGLLELLQPTLLVAIAGALGVVVGRASHRAVLVIIVGVFAWMVLFPFYWLWNTPPIHVVAPIQSMPLRVRIPDISSIRDTPSDWFVEYPTEYESDFVRDLVHTPTVVFHDLYLLGLMMVVAASIARQHKRTVRLAGVSLAVIGVAAQLIVSPF